MSPQTSVLGPQPPVCSQTSVTVCGEQVVVVPDVLSLQEHALYLDGGSALAVDGRQRLRGDQNSHVGGLTASLQREDGEILRRLSGRSAIRVGLLEATK